MFQVGQEYVHKVSVTFAAVKQFAAITGDSNPIHLDPDYAATTPFGECIAHGALLNGYISAGLGMGMPGLGTIYLAQEIEYKAPVYIGETLRIRLRIEELLPKNGAVISVYVTGDDCVLIAEGKARVKLPRDPQPKPYVPSLASMEVVHQAA